MTSPAETSTPEARPTAEMRTALALQNDPLPALLTRLKISDWQVLIAGDGSGNAADKACGWAGILIDQQTRGRRISYGAVNAGSINFAETMPYLQLLTWFDQYYGKDRLEKHGSIRVHIVTDSQVVAGWGAAAMSPTSRTPRKQGPYWAAMRYLRSLGYICEFHWAPRQSTQLNIMADLIAGLSRAAMIEFPGTETTATATICQRAATAIEQLDFQTPCGDPLDVYVDTWADT